MMSIAKATSTPVWDTTKNKEFMVDLEEEGIILDG
jgi:hypothetical protein